MIDPNNTFEQQLKDVEDRLRRLNTAFTVSDVEDVVYRSGNHGVIAAFQRKYANKLRPQW